LIYNKYKDSRHPAYVKAAKHASSLIKQTRRNFEELLDKQIKEDRKSFFACARSKSKCNVRVGEMFCGIKSRRMVPKLLNTKHGVQ